jgi:hypothetical protein
MPARSAYTSKVKISKQDGPKTKKVVERNGLEGRVTIQIASDRFGPRASIKKSRKAVLLDSIMEAISIQQRPKIKAFIFQY